MVRAVSDSGPIIHLAEVNCFHTLQIAEEVIPMEYLDDEYKGKVKIFCANLIDVWIREFLKG